MKLRSGHIPLDIVYIFGTTIKVTNRWDDADQSDEELVYTEVTPAFVADADNEKTINTGMNWASGRCTKWNPVTKCGEVVGTVQKLKRENQPISGIRVVSLEVRGEGGRAYKVVTPDGFYFDLREDVLLDTMLTKGIQPGGLLAGEYLWARVGTEMKLVRIGSLLFLALLESGERSILAPIPKNKLEVGRIYESKLGERGIFLGYITTESWKLVWPNGRSAFSNLYMKTDAKPTLSGKTLNKHMLWFDVSHWTLKDKKTDPTPGLFFAAMDSEKLSYHFKLRGSHSMVRSLGSVPVPSDLIEQVRQKALRAYQANVHAIWCQRQANKLFTAKKTYEIEHAVSTAASTLLMRNLGAPRPTISEPEFLRVEQLMGKEIS